MFWGIPAEFTQKFSQLSHVVPVGPVPCPQHRLTAAWWSAWSRKNPHGGGSPETKAGIPLEKMSSSYMMMSHDFFHQKKPSIETYKNNPNQKITGKQQNLLAADPGLWLPCFDPAAPNITCERLVIYREIQENHGTSWNILHGKSWDLWNLKNRNSSPDFSSDKNMRRSTAGLITPSPIRHQKRHSPGRGREGREGRAQPSASWECRGFRKRHRRPNPRDRLLGSLRLGQWITNGDGSNQIGHWWFGVPIKNGIITIITENDGDGSNQIGHFDGYRFGLTQICRPEMRYQWRRKSKKMVSCQVESSIFFEKIMLSHSHVVFFIKGYKRAEIEAFGLWIDGLGWTSLNPTHCWPGFSRLGLGKAPDPNYPNLGRPESLTLNVLSSHFIATLIAECKVSIELYRVHFYLLSCFSIAMEFLAE